MVSLFKEKLPNVNIISRFGGDEFVILIECLSTDKNTGIHQIETVFTVIHGMFMQPFYCGRNEIYSKVSVEISLFNDVAENQFDLLKQADLALSDAKAHDKSTHRFFNLQLQLDLIRRTNLKKDLRNAISENELFLVYQPQVGPDSSVVGV